MKLSKEELIEKVNGYNIDDEIKIELLENISDSMEVTETDNTEMEEIKRKYEELKEKYKERFLIGEKEDVEETDEETEEDEDEDEKVIDIKEI